MIGWNQTLGLGALLFGATSHRRTVSKEETLAGLLQQHPPPPRPPGVTGGGPENEMAVESRAFGRGRNPRGVRGKLSAAYAVPL